MSANITAGCAWVVPWVRSPAREAHHSSAAVCASAKQPKSSPAQNEVCTNWTARSTRPLSCGARTLAGSIRNPRDWAYSTNATFNTGSSASAFVTTVAMLSGTSTLNTPPKNVHAASHPSITVARFWLNDNHTNV